MKFSRLVIVSATVGLFLAAGVAFAQETRATLTGHVADPSGATIPDAKISITDTDTGVVTNAASNSAGDYTVPFLAPGTYRIAVTAPGFKTYVHSGIVLQTEQTVTENIKLGLGTASETVTVEGETPLVDTATASTGQTLTSEEVEDLPSNGRSPLGFAHLEYGAVAKGKHAASQTRPFDNSTADDFSLGGGASSSNELLLNGIPNMEDSSRTAGFSPELDAVDAVHVDEFAANAALGDTSGGVVNITTKSGTNQYHGTVSEYYAGSRPLTAKPYYTAAGTNAPSTHFNQFGATIGGPISVPWVFSGKNKLFFFYAFEGYIGNSPATTITSVPTAAERTGDFSQILAYNSGNQLYNPYSGVYAASKITRTAIPNNCLVATCGTTAGAGLTIDPVAQAYLNLIPLPNYSGASTKADGENNFFASDPTINNYKSHQARIDYDITHSDRISVEAHRSKYLNEQSNIFNNLLSGTASRVTLWGGFVENTHTFTPTTNLDLRLGFSRYETTSEPTSAGVSPSSFGFPGYIAANSHSLAIPYLTFTDGAAIPSLSGQPGSIEYFDDIQLFGSFNKTIGHHNIKLGPDIRSNKNSSLSATNSNSSYSFTYSSTSPVTYGTTGIKQPFGSTLALFELGIPTGGTEAINTPFQYNNWYIGSFIQDDWKVLPNFSVSLGLRVEHETPTNESQNRMITGFNPTAVNAATVQAVKNYTANPSSPLLPASAFNAAGGAYYASSSQRNGYFTATAYLSPRIGFAYSPAFSHNTLAIRGGFGIYDNPFNDYNVGQSYGYSATTAFANSNLSDGDPTSTLSHPFDPGVNPIVPPLGSSLGYGTNLGGSVIYFANVHVSYTEKASLDIQKQVGKNWLFEAGGLTGHGVHLSYSNAINSTPLLPYLSRSPKYDAAATTLLGGSVANPFYQTLPTGGPNTTTTNTKNTIATTQLLSPFPQFTSVTQQLVPGQTLNFNAFMFKISKRMSNGLLLNVNYIHSRNLGAQVQLNPGGPLSYEETSSDFPDHVSVMAIYQLPFGRGRMLFNQSRLADEIIGGWEVTGIYQFLSGTPLSFGNSIYTGNWSNWNNRPHDARSTTPTFNTSGFDTVAADQPNAYNYRTFPQNILRSDPNNNFDFSALKNFTLGEHFVIQPRVDAFNAFNHPQFSAANSTPTSASFGLISSQLNTNRTLQGGVHILF